MNDPGVLPCRVTPGRRDGVVHAIVGRAACRCLCKRFRQEETRLVLVTIGALFVTQIVRTMWSGACWKWWSANATPLVSRFTCRLALDLGPASVAPHVHWQPHEGDDDCDNLWCVGHHAIDARSVLGTAQASALRFDRAGARPSGLDDACAQIASWPLRDGRRMNAATEEDRGSQSMA